MTKKWMIAIPVFAILAWAAGTQQDTKTVISSATKARPTALVYPARA